MSRKSVRDMSQIERWFHSLTVRSTIGVQLLALAVGTVILIAGFMLYYNGILYEYKVNTCLMAKAESVMLDPDETRVKADEILAVYKSIPESEKDDTYSEEYRAKYELVMDDTFLNIQQRLRSMKEKVGLRNAYIAAIDEENGRMINLVDSDPNPETFCPPGSLDYYSVESMQELVHGKEISFLQEKTGLSDPPQASITHTEKYGTRCVGGVTLYEAEDYTVMVCLEEKLDVLNEISKVFMLQYVLLLVAVLFIIGVIAIIVIRRSMVLPINHLANAARRYSVDKHKEGTNADHFRNLRIRRGDEIEELNLTMADMEDSLAEYIANMTKVTAERERINTELELAARIQEAFLPTTFPAYPERDDFDVYAAMTPAKMVGGDFYNFFLIDDDHLALMIADVAGKGIPAALFMMISKIMLDNEIVEEQSPAKAFEQVNTTMCKNEEEMFVTVWLGILELSTGKITASNAGHEKPVIIHPDGKIEIIRDKHGFVIGGLEGMKYKDYELQLEPGDKLLLYTDGVPEATAVDKEMFGSDRLKETVDGLGAATAEETIAKVTDAVDAFVGEAQQFDDLTMLCVQWFGQADKE